MSNVTETLNKVPSMTYSVSCFSSLAFKSPKRKIDFAASRNPTPAYSPISIKLNISPRSKRPILWPAAGMLPDVAKPCVIFSSIMRINTELGFNTSM